MYKSVFSRFLLIVFFSLVSFFSYSEEIPVIVFAKKDGQKNVIKIEDVDSIYFSALSESESAWKIWDTDTIHVVDTVYHIDSVYYENPEFIANSVHSLEKRFVKKEPLRVLHIGNSFTVDATAYLNDVIEASGSDVSDMCLYIMNKNFCSFHSWVNTFNGVEKTDFIYQKIFGGLDASVGGAGAQKFHNVLTQIKWDLIILQQVSSYSDNFELWGGWSEAGGLDSLLSIIRTYQPEAEIGFTLTHSSYSNSVGAKQTVEERWRLIKESTKKMKEHYGISFVVPYGTAVENLRLSRLNNIRYLTRDGHHLEQGLTRYAAACAYYQALVAPRSGISVLGNACRRKMLNASYLDITDETAPIAQMAAFLATAFWWKNLNPEDYLDK